MRQGCLSPLLFNLLMADLEKVGKVKWGRVKVEEGKIHSLAYADEVLL